MPALSQCFSPVSFSLFLFSDHSNIQCQETSFCQSSTGRKASLQGRRLTSSRTGAFHGGKCQEGNGNPLQSSCLENPMDGGAWWAAVHGVAESRTRLSDFTFTFHLQALEKEMATHSSVLAWRIPGMGEPGGLPSMGSHRVGHDWSDLAAAGAAWGKWKHWEQCFHLSSLLLISQYVIKGVTATLILACWTTAALARPSSWQAPTLRVGLDFCLLLYSPEPYYFYSIQVLYTHYCFCGLFSILLRKSEFRSQGGLVWSSADNRDLSSATLPSWYVLEKSMCSQLQYFSSV